MTPFEIKKKLSYIFNYQSFKQKSSSSFLKGLKTKLQVSQMDISKDQNTSFSKEHAISMPYKSYPTGFVYLFFKLYNSVQN